MWVMSLAQFLFNVFIFALIFFIIFVEIPSFILTIIKELKK